MKILKKNKKISYSDILSAIIFIPESSNKIINYLRVFLKFMFKLIAKIIFR